MYPHASLSIQLPHARTIRTASASLNGDVIQVIHADSTAWNWNINSGRPVGPYKTKENSLFVRWLNDNKTIAEIDKQGVLHLQKSSVESLEEFFSISVCDRPAYLWVLKSSLEIICVSKHDTLERWRIDGRRKRYLGVLPGANSEWKFVSSSAALVGFHARSPELIYLRADSILRRISLPPKVKPVVVAVSAVSNDVAVGASSRAICLWNASTDAWNCAEPVAPKEVDRYAGLFIEPYKAIGISSDGREIVAASTRYITFVRQSDRALQADEVAHNGYDTIGLFFAGKKALIVNKYSLSIADPLTSKEVGTFAILRADAWSGTWAVLSSAGAFDTGDIEGARDLFSIAREDQETSDEILRLLYPKEAGQAPARQRLPMMIRVSSYTRNYFRPGLLSQIMLDRLPSETAMRPVESLNRAIPKVQIKDVVMCDEQVCPERSALVTVLATPEKGFVSRDGVVTNYDTDVFDLRLFRNGQLVGQRPKPKVGIGGPQDIEAWREDSRVRMNAGEDKAEHSFRVPLRSQDRGKPVVFTAYAFNDDRVKSEIATNDKFKVPEDMPLRRPKAFVITVGIDKYAMKSRDLSFAAKDARDLSAALSRIKGHEVVRLTLVSGRAQGKSAATDQATKANIRSVLNLLAGKSEAERGRLKGVSGIDKRVIGQLRKATPDDLVIIAFSGHGYTDPRSGQFYMLPSDSGEEPGFGPRQLSRFISSEELSQWIREVDAGQMAMIIDACHSAGAVDMPGFKPGPMGDRGLGQLAYDKGMMILAATQASDVALESKKIQQGLLTYALIADGFIEKVLKPKRRNADIDNNGVLTLKEWLQYGEQRVPGLYEDIRIGKLTLVSRDPTPADPGWKASTVRRAQTPSLFDFQRRPIIVELGMPALKRHTSCAAMRRPNC